MLEWLRGLGVIGNDGGREKEGTEITWGLFAVSSVTEEALHETRWEYRESVRAETIYIWVAREKKTVFLNYWQRLPTTRS